MTTRELLIEDREGIETVLCELENTGIEHKLTELQVIRAMARAPWHILGWIITRIDNERRGK